jgi:hypothetical protein
MTAFSPLDAAFEGLRVVRREPRAVLYWIAVWAMALVAIAVVRLSTGALLPPHGAIDDYTAVRRFGPLAVVLAPTVLTLWVMTSAIVYRAVLRPGEHGWHLFKLGPDEARIAVLSAIGTVLLTLLGGAPAYLLLVLLNPIFEVAPGFSRLTAMVGFATTILIDFWIAVRLSLMPVQTFAERSFPFDRYWSFTRGYYWRLLVGYVVVFAEVLAFLVAFVIVGIIFGVFATAAIHWRGAGLLRPIALWTLVAILALLTAVAWVVPAVLICGFQAYAYRAIAGAGAAKPA